MTHKQYGSGGVSPTRFAGRRKVAVEEGRIKKVIRGTENMAKGGAGFESAISGWLVSPAVRPLNFFYFMYCT